MRRSRLMLPVLLLALGPGGFGADPITVTKVVSSQAHPWAVTLSINHDYPFAGNASQPTITTFSADDGFGFRAGDVLTIQYGTGLWCITTMVTAGTCVDANGYPNYAPANDQLFNASFYAPSKYINPSSYPIYLMALVGTFADDRGQIVGTPFKVGNGPVNVTIPSGANRLQLGANLWNYSDARNYYTPLTATVSGPPPPAMNPVGSIAHLAVGGGWKTTFVLLNSGTTSAQARLNFFDDDGRSLSLAVSIPGTPMVAQLLSTIEQTLPAGGSLTVESTGPASGLTQQGWAQLVSDGDVTAFAVFGCSLGDRTQEVVVPLETRSAATYVVWFDHTGQLASGLALANISGGPGSTVSVTMRDESGALIGTDTLVLPGHTAFVASQQWPQTVQRRGALEFHTTAGGQISVLGLRFNAYAFTAIPVITR